jgi:hypothetical protein
MHFLHKKAIYNFMYRGETFQKNITRLCKWIITQKYLGEDFYTTPHLFLASRIAGDIKPLLAMRVKHANIWLIEKDLLEYSNMSTQIKKDPDYKIFTKDITNVVRKYHIDKSLQSIYLDYCGTIKENWKTSKQVLDCMSPNSVISFTHVKRERGCNQKNRLGLLVSLVKERIKHPVSLIQNIHYQSKDDSSNGSSMMTTSFLIGNHNVSHIDHIDLCHLTEKDMLSMVDRRLSQLGYSINSFL